MDIIEIHDSLSAGFNEVVQEAMLEMAKPKESNFEMAFKMLEERQAREKEDLEAMIENVKEDYEKYGAAFAVYTHYPCEEYASKEEGLQTILECLESNYNCFISFQDKKPQQTNYFRDTRKQDKLVLRRAYEYIVVDKQLYYVDNKRGLSRRVLVLGHGDRNNLKIKDYGSHITEWSYNVVLGVK